MSFFPNPITASGTTTPRTLGVRFGEVFNVKDFGAIGDGITEDSTAIQAAVNQAILLSAGAIGDNYRGAVVYVPKGTYLVSNNISWSSSAASGITLIGDGPGITIIKCNRASGDIITIGDTTNRIDNTRILDMTFYSVPQMSSGAIIRVINGYNTTLRNLRFPENPDYPTPLSGNAFNSSFTRIYTCIDIQSGSVNQLAFQTYIENVNINNGVVGIKLGDNGGIVQDTYISKSIIAQCVDTGILLKNTGGTYLTDGSTLYCKTGLATYPDSGKNVMWTFMTGWVCDTSVTDGFKIITNGGVVRSIQMVNCWASNNGRWQNDQSSSVTFPSEGRGMWVSQGTGTVGALTITNFTALTNRQEGFYVTGASKISLMNPNFCGNSAFSSNSYDGANFFNTSEWSVTGGMSGNTIPNLTNTQRYGLSIGGTSNQYQVIGMNLYGNQTGGLDDGGGVTKYVAGNLS